MSSSLSENPRVYAARELGAPGPTTPPSTCRETAGSRDGVAFTAAEACKAVVFLDTARTSDMWRLPRSTLDFIPFGGPNRPPGDGQRSRWTRLNECTDAAGVGKTSVQACFLRVGAESASGYQTQDCYANTLRTRVQARGEFAVSSTRGSGGYVLWLNNSGFRPAAPAAP